MDFHGEAVQGCGGGLTVWIASLVAEGGKLASERGSSEADSSEPVDSHDHHNIK